MVIILKALSLPPFLNSLIIIISFICFCIFIIDVINILTWNGYLSFLFFFLINCLLIVGFPTATKANNISNAYAVKTYKRFHPFLNTVWQYFNSSFFAKYPKLKYLKRKLSNSTRNTITSSFGMTATVWMNLQLCYMIRSII
jgi:hypothetical protein